MKKYENFCNCLKVLKKSNREKCIDDEIYRMGIIGQFNLSFELAWKALQNTLVLHGVADAKIGSPLEVIKLGFKTGFLNNEAVFLDMLKSRNTAVHIYNEDEFSEIISSVYEKYIPALNELKKYLPKKSRKQKRKFISAKHHNKITGTFP